MWILLVPLASDATPLTRWVDTGDNATMLTRRAALRFAETSASIAAAGRIEQLPVLRTDAEDLLRAAQALDRFVAEEIE